MSLLPKGYSLKELIFSIVFLLHCLIGGAIAFSGIVPFRPYYTSVIVLLTIFIYKIKTDPIFKFHLFFAFLIILSGIINNSSLMEMLIGLRLPVISFTMYLIVDSYFCQKRERIEEIIKGVAFIQLPVVLFQLVFSSTLINYSTIPTAFHDIRYGTFYVKSDPIMSLFLTLTVIYLLFKKKKKRKWDIIVLVGSALTVFLASSKVIQLVLFFILGYYFFTHSNFKQKAYSLSLVSVLVLILTITGYHQNFLNQFNKLYSQMFFKEEAQQVEKFKAGNYARLGAILYFLNEPVKLIGDGPGKYTNPLANTMELGLTGSSFKMYAEYGIIGLFYSIWGIFFIVFEKLKKGFYRYLIILALVGLSVTSDIYNSAGLMFIFYLLLYLHKNEIRVNMKKLFLYKEDGIKRVKLSRYNM